MNLFLSRLRQAPHFPGLGRLRIPSGGKSLCGILFLSAAAILLPSAWATVPDPDVQDMPVVGPGASPVKRKITWPGTDGRIYFVQMSTDLIHWSYTPFVERGADQPIEWQFELVGSRSFFRLKYTTGTDYPPGAADGDIDGDGLINSAELSLGTDPFSADSDGDGMPDGFEVLHGLVPLSAEDASLDPDQDSLTNLKEYQLGTKPGLKDSDEDGINDNVEYAAGGNPAKFDMPAFTVLASWRKVLVSNTRNIPASGAPTVSAQALVTSAGTAAGTPGKAWTPASPVFPWNLQTVASSVWNAGVGDPSGRPAIPLADPVTPHDMSRPLFSSYQQRMKGIADFVAGSPSGQESRVIERAAVLVERVIRIQAKRAMPKAWSIPYNIRKIKQSNATSDWGPVTTLTTDSGSQPLRFIFNPGDTFSNAVTLGLGGMDNPSCDLPGRAKDLNGNGVMDAVAPGTQGLVKAAAGAGAGEAVDGLAGSWDGFGAGFRTGSRTFQTFSATIFWPSGVGWIMSS